MKVLLLARPTGARSQLARMLRQCGHDVTSVCDAPSALQRLPSLQPVVVLCEDPLDPPCGAEFCRRARAISQPESSYLVVLSDSGPPASAGGQDAAVDDYLIRPVRQADLVSLLAVADRTLRRRGDEALQWKRVVRIPADCPHPILELTPSGDLLHANPAALPLLEGWGWMAGSPTPAPLRSLLEAVTGPDPTAPRELPCSDQIYSFIAIRTDEGSITLYGHQVSPGRRRHPGASPTGSPSFEISRRDALTGLPHRSIFNSRLEECLDRARAQQSGLALVKVNIDNCRDLNESLGQDLADLAIQLVAHCLEDHIGPEDILCREAGDQFALLVVGTRDRESLGALCERIATSVTHRASDANLETQITLSTGFALFPDDAQDTPQLVANADQALAEAKHAGRDCWRDYSSVAGTNPLVGGAPLFSRLAKALHSHRIEVQYQPILDARTGQVTTFEALARWYEPDLGWIAPGRFIAIAEARGLIAELGRQVAGLAFAQLASWREEARPPAVALNVSKRQLLDHRFAAEMLELAATHQVSPGNVVLEATERQSLLQDLRCRNVLDELASNGFRLSLDDFGVGHSSFDMVAELPFRELKIDMGLSRKAVTPRGRAIVTAIVRMCEDLGLESVAEGIEDAATGNLLRSIGATRLQGNLYSLPLKGAEATGFLRGRCAASGAAAGASRLTQPAWR